MSYHWYDFVGNIGIVLVIGAYLLLQTGKVSITNWRYSAANGLGAILILVSLYYAFNLSSFIIEIVWLMISGYGLIKAFKGKDG